MAHDTRQLRSFHLFAGAGGGILGDTLLGHRVVGACEIEEYPRNVLLQRQRDGILPAFPVWDDIRALDARPWRGHVDIVAGGFPCQPFSLEGKRDWTDSAKNLWPETARILCEIRPKYVLLENVRGVCAYLPVVVRDLRRAGYTVERPAIISAGSAGALHIRERVWIFAHADSKRRVWERHRLSAPAWTGTQTWAEFARLATDVLQSCVPASRGDGVVDAVAGRMDRLRAIGNGQDAVVAALAWQILTGTH